MVPRLAVVVVPDGDIQRHATEAGRKTTFFVRKTQAPIVSANETKQSASNLSTVCDSVRKSGCVSTIFVNGSGWLFLR